MWTHYHARDDNRCMRLKVEISKSANIDCANHPTNGPNICLRLPASVKFLTGHSVATMAKPPNFSPEKNWNLKLARLNIQFLLPDKNTWKRTYICRWWYRRNLCHGCGSADSISLCLPHFQHCLLGCFSPLRPKIYQNGHSGGAWRSNKIKPHPSPLRCMLLGSIFVIQSQWVSFLHWN